MSKGILVTSFGTSHKDTREKCLDSIQKEVEKKYGSEKVERAYTSGVVRRIVERKENIHIYDQEEGLKALKDKGFDEIITMSLHILNGIEYSKLNDKYGKITKPLLTTEEDYKRIVNDTEFNDLEGNDVIIFMGHGSESAADITYEKLQEAYNKAGKNNIFVATVEGKVTIEDVIEKLKQTDYKKVLLKPFMIVAGDHAKNDMASDEEDSWKTILQNNGYEVTPVLKGMGEYKLIRDMFMEKLDEAYGKNEKSNTELVVKKEEEPKVEKKLYKSRTDKKITGVCGGLGKYFNVDSTIVRIIWAIAFFVGGTGGLAYIVAALIIPEEPVGNSKKSEDIVEAEKAED
ncbi:sirohydrochlorin cobaltochelatase [Pseudoleptotrichia goodfellowii]|uniref:PspC domain protein n=1 Tax=Pseudoleptotrichia goodfellowii F0264 TaxID=596323 RepID=D0GL53_9FUSO|nr:sirohydrochlorin cobaltochelatase [Pseudoleptotrichia goodfellowii]EEY35145.1 PspC domain protein [Pseudoleptotrichia goodfellowii F0264]